MAEIRESWRSKLLNCLQRPDINAFKMVFEEYKYSNKTQNIHFWENCFEKAASMEGGDEFIAVMLKHGVRWRKNVKFKEPLHLAASSGQATTLRHLLKHKKTDVNAVDNLGRTALHHLVRNFPKHGSEEVIARYEECMALLFSRKQIDINKLNKKGFSALYEAANFGNERCITAFLNLSKSSVDVDVLQGSGRTAREIIADKYPSLNHLLPEICPQRKANVDQTTKDLFKLLHKKRLKDFITLVYAVDHQRQPIFNLDSTLKRHGEDRTCLMEACAINHREDFIKVLLTAGSYVNFQERKNGKTALHIAIESNNVKALNLLLNDERANVNMTDFHGRPALHLAVQRLEADVRFLCTVSLLRHPKIDINVIDCDRRSAILIAAESGDETIVRLLLSYSPDLDVPSGESDITARHLLKSNFPSLVEELGGKVNDCASKLEAIDCLTKYLHENRARDFVFNFKKYVKSDVDLLESNIGEDTFLQYACSEGMREVVKVMLRKGANPNMVKYGNRSPPFVLACQKNHSDIVPLFFRLPDDSKFDINATDISGNSGLFYAAANGNVPLVHHMLKEGADMKSLNLYGKSAMSSDVMESLLNFCVKTNGLSQNDPDLELTFDYSAIIRDQNEPKQPLGIAEDEIWLGNSDLETGLEVPSNKRKTILEMEFFQYISESEQYQHLLQHPVVSLFLDIKWMRIRLFFYIKLILYIAFVILLNLYVILCDLKLRQKYLKESDADNYNETTNETTEQPEVHVQTSTGLKIFLYITYLILLLATLADTCVTIYKIPLALLKPCKVTSGTQIFKQIFTLSHLLDFSVNIFTSVFLYHLRGHHVQELAAVIIVLGSWTKLVLLLGNFSKLSTNIKLIQDVLHRYAPYLLSYSLLIIGFAISFYILFDDDGFFSLPTSAIFKTAVMMMGEFDLTQKQLSLHPGISHVVFLLFMVLIVIVMLNILSIFLDDAQALRNNAKIVRLISRVELMTDIEHLLTKVRDTRFVWAILSKKSRVSRWFRRIRVFPDFRNNKVILVLPNRDRKLILCDVVQGSRADEKAVKDAMKILNPDINDLSRIQQELEKQTQLLIDLKNSIR